MGIPNLMTFPCLSLSLIFYHCYSNSISGLNKATFPHRKFVRLNKPLTNLKINNQLFHVKFVTIHPRLNPVWKFIYNLRGISKKSLKELELNFWPKREIFLWRIIVVGCVAIQLLQGKFIHEKLRSQNFLSVIFSLNGFGILEGPHIQSFDRSLYTDINHENLLFVLIHVCYFHHHCYKKTFCQFMHFTATDSIPFLGLTLYTIVSTFVSNLQQPKIHV